MIKIDLQNPHNPLDNLDLSPLRIAGYTVTRTRVPGTVRTLYRVMHLGQVAGQQLSYPSAEQCHAYAKAIDASHRSTRPRRIRTVIDAAQGTLAERVVHVLQLESMDEAQLIGTMRTSSQALSPILNKLVKNMRIRRTGAPGNYCYAVR